MTEEKNSPLPCIAIDFRTRLMLEHNMVDPISSALRAFEDKIAYEYVNPKDKQISYSFKDGSIIIFSENSTGIVDPKMVFISYMKILQDMKKTPPNMEQIKRDVASKLKDLKRRTRGDNS